MAEQIVTTLVASDPHQPVFATAPPGDASRLFILDRTGEIRILDLASGHLLPAPFLDISSQVATAGEEGLLGMAFDPNYAANGKFYLDFVDLKGNTEIKAYHVSAANPDLADPTSGQTILAIPQPAGLTNHKAGWIGFGPDGDLYIATGDGGGEGDPLNNGQNPGNLLGKILRIDVQHPAAGAGYSVPADNPFVGVPGASPEIWALGLRNPWRDSFDPATGQLYIADVGQDQWEEVDLGKAGANYGWKIFEGPQVFSPGTISIGQLTGPIFSYPHTTTASATIIGGDVYRGPGTALQGQYFFADYVRGTVSTLQQQPDGSWTATDHTAEIDAGVSAAGGHLTHPVSFGEDALHNLYIIDQGGDIFRLTPMQTDALM